MKFKEIKPGMVIHCPTEEKANAFLEGCRNQGIATRGCHLSWDGVTKCYGVSDGLLVYVFGNIWDNPELIGWANDDS